MLIYLQCLCVVGYVVMSIKIEIVVFKQNDSIFERALRYGGMLKSLAANHLINIY